MQLAEGFPTQHFRPGPHHTSRATPLADRRQLGESHLDGQPDWTGGCWISCKQHTVTGSPACTWVASSGMDMSMCLGVDMGNGMDSTAARSTCSRAQPSDPPRQASVIGSTDPIPRRPGPGDRGIRGGEPDSSWSLVRGCNHLSKVVAITIFSIPGQAQLASGPTTARHHPAGEEEES